MAQAPFPEPTAAAGSARSGAAALFHHLRSGDWLNRGRILAYARILLAIQTITLAIMIAGTHGWIVPLHKPATTDFVSFYAAGSLVDAGTPALAYDQDAHYAAEERATEPGIGYQFFYYPPVYLLLCAVFAGLPYLAAFIAFEALTLVAYLMVARRILGERSDAVLWPLIAFPAVFWTLGLGQNSFLTAALFGAATLLVDRRPIIAGLLFGALCYKPHFGLLVPVALAAGGHWRSFAAAALSASTLVLLSLAFFGWETWHSFLLTAAGSHATYENGRIDLTGMISPFAAFRLAGIDTVVAYAGQGVATLGAALLVAVIWRWRVSLPVRAAALIAATTVSVPVILLYDLMLIVVAVAWLVRAGRETGFLPWEKAAVLAAFAAALATRSAGLTVHVPLALMADVVLIAVIGIRAQHEIMLRQRAA